MVRSRLFDPGSCGGIEIEYPSHKIALLHSIQINIYEKMLSARSIDIVKVSHDLPDKLGRIFEYAVCSSRIRNSLLLIKPSIQ